MGQMIKLGVKRFIFLEVVIPKFKVFYTYFTCNLKKIVKYFTCKKNFLRPWKNFQVFEIGKYMSTKKNTCQKIKNICHWH
jgi:hypothetical protein